MRKAFHELRDPINVFIRYDSSELDVINSEPFQRLRHIHQLGLTFLLYPGATHRRFEHSLGVMELATRVFDVITNDNNVHPQVKDLLPQIVNDDVKRYWKRVLRMAALCHDLGHLPFSHVSEDLLPEGFSHEHITVNLIRSKDMSSIWQAITPPLRADDIAKLAVGPKILKEEFSDWEVLLSEIIVGDAFGVDRMDYLLRDSLHAGVIYGKFDHNRLIDTLRILPTSENSKEPTLGVESGGIHSAEALLLARFFMFIQVYLHPVRRIYDLHLKDFLLDWLQDGKYPTDLVKFLGLTDNEVTAAFLSAARDSGSAGHSHAKRIVYRDHFKVLYERNPQDIAIHPEPGLVIYEAAKEKFGNSILIHDRYLKGGGATSFPVLSNDQRIVQSLTMSTTLANIPNAAIDFVFVDSAKRDAARKWLEENREEALNDAKIKGEEE